MFNHSWISLYLKLYLAECALNVFAFEGPMYLNVFAAKHPVAEGLAAVIVLAECLAAEYVEFVLRSAEPFTLLLYNP